MEFGVQEVGEQNEEIDVVNEDILSRSKDDLDSADFDFTVTLYDYYIEVFERMIERCVIQFSINEKIVGGRRLNNSVDFGRVRYFVIMKNE